MRKDVYVVRAKRVDSADVSLMREALERLRCELPMNGYDNCFYCDIGVPRDNEFLHGSSQFPDEPHCLYHRIYEDSLAIIKKLEKRLLNE